MANIPPQPTNPLLQKALNLLAADEKKQAEYRALQFKLMQKIADIPNQPQPQPQPQASISQNGLTVEYRISKQAIEVLAKWNDPTTNNNSSTRAYLPRLLQTRDVVKCLETHKITGHVVFEI